MRVGQLSLCSLVLLQPFGQWRDASAGMLHILPQHSEIWRVLTTTDVGNVIHGHGGTAHQVLHRGGRRGGGGCKFHAYRLCPRHSLFPFLKPLPCSHTCFFNFCRGVPQQWTFVRMICQHMRILGIAQELADGLHPTIMVRQTTLYRRKRVNTNWICASGSWLGLLDADALQCGVPKSHDGYPTSEVFNRNRSVGRPK